MAAKTLEQALEQDLMVFRYVVGHGRDDHGEFFVVCDRSTGESWGKWRQRGAAKREAAKREYERLEAKGWS
jgi:hypothetical protein